VLSLTEIQAGIGRALVNGDNSQIRTLLRGGAHPEHRLAIHQRHYVASLTRALVERFPATVWLVGSDLVASAAQSFTREHPPLKPCIAEYGEGFPAYLAAFTPAGALPYLAQFVELEWHLGRLALATSDSTHVHYLRLEWALDELMAIFLADRVPEQFTLRHEDVWLEVRGVRGELEMTRLAQSEFVARTKEPLDAWA
jgi:hypothetical protein